MSRNGIRRFHWWAAFVAVLVFAAFAPGASVSNTHAQAGGTFATPTIDGDAADWAAIPGTNLTLEQFAIPAGSDWEFNGTVDPVSAVLKVANDGENIYVLVTVADTFDFVADDHKLSPALGVMFLIDAAAGTHMGSGDDDLEAGLGMVDIWHWELDCAAGTLSGGGPAGSGNDPDCNLDDEYATDPETREDDDGAGAENSIVGSFNHDGTNWVFEMSRPLNTGDATDAQFAAGGVAKIAIAYWDPKESAVGWSDAGHLVSSDAGWIVAALANAPTADTPTTAPNTPTTAPDAPTTAPGETPVVPPTGTGLAAETNDGGFPAGGLAIAGGLVVALVIAGAAFSLKRRQA